MIEIVAGLLLVVGAGFALIAALGLIRLPDVLTRMHASTKAATLASTLVLIGAALYFRDATVTAKAVAAMLFLLLTAPIAAHMIGRAYVRLKAPDRIRYDAASAATEVVGETREEQTR